MVVTVQGILDSAGAQQLQVVLRDLVENQGNLKVEVDLAEVTAMGSASLAALVEAATQAGERGGQLFVRNAPEGAPEISAPRPPSDVATPARRLHAMAWHPATGGGHTGQWPPAPGRGVVDQ